LPGFAAIVGGESRTERATYWKANLFSATF